MNRTKTTAVALACAVALLGGGATLAADSPDPRETEQARREMERARQEVEKAREELQRATRELARSMAAVERDNPKAQYFEYITDPKRAMLGIVIDDEPNKDDPRGVRVLAVTPGGGAEKGGLKTGDLMLSLNGKPLAGDERKPPARRLREAMRELKAGDTAKLEVERGGRKQVVSVVTTGPDEKGALALPMVPNLEDLEDLEHFWPKAPMLGFRSPAVRGLELAKLDEDMAWYFKTKDGVLVVKAPKASPLPLKSGDVIQKIDGAAVAEPVTVLDKLRSRGAEQSVKLEVVRQGRKTTLDAKVPAVERRQERRRIEIHSDEDPEG